MKVFKTKQFSKILGSFLIIYFGFNIYSIFSYYIGSFTSFSDFLIFLELTIFLYVGIILFFRRRVTWYAITLFITYRLIYQIPLNFGYSFYQFIDSRMSYFIGLIKTVILISLLFYFFAKKNREYSIFIKLSC